MSKVWVLIYLDEDSKNNENAVEVFGSDEKAKTRLFELLSYMDTELEEDVLEKAWIEIKESGSYYEEGAEITFYLLEKEVQ